MQTSFNQKCLFACLVIFVNLSAETALQQVLIPEHVCCTAPYWVIGYKLPKPIQNQQELESLFTWHNFFAEFASNADEFKDFNPRDE